MSLFSNIFKNKSKSLNNYDYDEIYSLIEPAFNNPLIIDNISYNNFRMYDKLIKIVNIKKRPLFFDLVETFNKFEFDEKIDSIQLQITNITRQLYSVLISQYTDNKENNKDNVLNEEQVVVNSMNSMREYWDNNDAFIFMRKYFDLDLNYDLTDFGIDKIGIFIIYKYKHV